MKNNYLTLGKTGISFPDFNNPPDLSHLVRLTTDIGIYQHAKNHTPDPKNGYSIDDNARALIVALKYYKLFNNDLLIKLAKIYLNFINKAQLKNGWFHNYASEKGQFFDKKGSFDNFGRAIWALGYTLSQTKTASNFKNGAKILPSTKILGLDKAMVLGLFQKSYPLIFKLKFSRPKAFCLLGLYYLEDKEAVKLLARDLVRDYKQNSNNSWFWFEEKLTYANGILPLALFLAYNLVGDKNYLKVALSSLKFLLKTCQYQGIPAPIGQKGWYYKDKKRAYFDQQCIDVADMVLANITAYKITNDEYYKNEAFKWFSWFFGNNMAGKLMYNAKTGGLYDGLKLNNINKNQGAESIICYLLAYLELADLIRSSTLSR